MSFGPIMTHQTNCVHRIKNVSEYELWCVFHCLARACLVIDHGSEDDSQPRWNLPQICHLDLKPENILIGSHTMDTEHRNMPPFKVGDFGLAKEMPSFQSKTFMNSIRAFGTAPWYLPVRLHLDLLFRVTDLSDRNKFKRWITQH